MERSSEKQLKDRAPEKSSSKPFSVDEEVAKAVLVGLSYFGTGNVVESLVYVLELEHSIAIQSVARNPSALRAALSSMFGGAEYVIETRICKALARQLGVDAEGKSLEDLISVLESTEI